MRRIFAALVLALIWTAVAAAGDAPPRRPVDLDAPGAMDALQKSNPTHYEKVRRILEGVPRQPDAVVPRWMRTNFDAQDVTYLPIVLTSHPPKRRLSFSLDATRYETIVILTNVHGEIVPAK